MKIESAERNIKLPPSLIRELEVLLYMVREEKNDLVLVIDGKEGMGKTRTAIAIGAYCAHVLQTPFGVSNVHYSTQEYMESCVKMGKNTVHLLDEAGVILHRSAANTKPARRFNRFLQVCREGYHQVHILILPAFHVMDGYVINWRCKFVMHLYGESIESDKSPTGRALKRGAFKVFTAGRPLTEMWNLYQDRKVFEYPKQFYIHDRFPYSEPFTEEELKALYDKKNTWREAFVGTSDDDTKGYVSKLAVKKETVKYMIQNLGFVPTPDNLVKALKVSRSYAAQLSRQISDGGYE